MDFSTLSVGTTVLDQTVTLDRDSLVRYAGASLDFNPIHYRDDVAESVGLPGVLAHGMLTMGVASSTVETWLDGSGWVESYQARFTKPVVVDALFGAELNIKATVSSLDEEKKSCKIDLEVLFQEKKVLGRAILSLVFFR